MRHLALPLLLVTAAACSSSAPSDTGATDATADSTADSAGGSGDDVEQPDTGSGSDAAQADTAEPIDWPEDPPTTAGGDRPAQIYRPADYSPDSTAYPIVLLLHGYGANGATQNIFLGTSTFVDELGFVLVVPDGTPSRDGSRFWAATPACCNFDGEPVDDVAYLTGLVREVMETHNIDTGRVYTFGHSNGGFMSYRLACEGSDLFTAIASLAGATYTTADQCTPATQPVSVLQIHGTADDTILYEGATEFWASPDGYPSAQQSVLTHATLLGCDTATPEEIGPLDLDVSLSGDDSAGVVYRAGCAAGTDAQLWTIEDGTHIPPINPKGTRLALQWLLSHDRTP